jgi:broad specificity phosphatase PhoE
MLHLAERGEATRLLLVRHTETDEAARGRCYGRLDVALSPAGIRQAEALGVALRVIPLGAVYSSPLARALGTAAAIAAAQGLGPVVHPDLVELDFGEVEGLPYEQIAAERPELYRAWMRAPASVQFPGGESLDDLRSRMRGAAGEIRERHPGEAVAVVGHGGVIRAVLADVLGLPSEGFFRLEQSFGGLSVVDWIEGVPIVRVVNAVLYS